MSGVIQENKKLMKICRDLARIGISRFSELVSNVEQILQIPLNCVL